MTRSPQCTIPPVASDGVVFHWLLAFSGLAVAGIALLELTRGNLKLLSFGQDKLPPTSYKFLVRAIALLFGSYLLTTAGDWVARHWLTCQTLAVPETWPTSVMLSGLAAALTAIHFFPRLLWNPPLTASREIILNLTFSAWGAAAAMVITTFWNNMLAVVWVPVIIALLPLSSNLLSSKGSKSEAHDVKSITPQS